jgi:tRNA pseudouridine55 synthase
VTAPATGFLLVDKEPGWTSHDVVAKVRSAVGGKVGHAGTLDPMATGLLVLALGRSTKLMRFVQAGDKEYLARAQLGVATDSLDADGAIIEREPLPVSEAQIVAAMSRFRGTVLQVPPMVSARKVEGKRLYELAREGKVIEREARPVTIHSLDLIDVAPSDYPEITFRVVCSTGTYVRTLADDIGRALGGRAHLTALRRVRSGSFDVADAERVETVVERASRGALSESMIPPWEALDELDALVVDEAVEFRVRNGRRLGEDLAPVPESELVRIGTSSGELVAVYRREGAELVPEVVFA